MKLSLLATIAIFSVALAQKGIPNGRPCKKDGSMGNCASGFCLQIQGESQGKCEEAK
ncbi:hypothetical protein PABG_06550 [Paracoccidioides brasiliensis Pb03]|nr:hypothetical protein PABG_06550 [Paracoccidioides brasiliensis Pb03]